MSKFWSKKVKEITPYTFGEQPKDKAYIKLNTNENPYPPSKYVNEALANYNLEKLKLYPDPICDNLITSIAANYDVDKDMIFVGNGSDEVLSFIFMGFFDTGDTVIMPNITYSFYDVYADFFQLKKEIVNLDEDFNINLKEYNREGKVIIFPNPNAPTGKYVEKSDIEELVKNNPDKLIVVDEAYIDFGGESSVDLTKKYTNILVVHTFSKSRSLAGMRVGYAIGSKELIEGLNRVKNSINSYTLNSLSLVAAEAAMSDTQYFEATRKKIIATREKTARKLKKSGFEVLDSTANFLFISHKDMNAEELYFRLKQNGVLVRHFNKKEIKNYIRLTIGTDFEMGIFFKRLKEIIKI